MSSHPHNPSFPASGLASIFLLTVSCYGPLKTLLSHIWLSLSDFFVLISRFLNSFWISFGSKNIWVLIWLSCCSWLNRISVELSISDFFLHHINWCWIWSLILKVYAAFKCVWSPFILVCNVRVNIIMWIYIFTIFSLVFLSCFHLSITFIN